MFTKLRAFFGKDAVNPTTRRGIFAIMLAGGIAALAAAFTLTIEKFQLYEDPNKILSCSINVVLNCSTVMQTPQSHVFGFPNMIIGLMAYPVVITIAVLGLSGAKFPRWFVAAATIGFLLGLSFSYWLFFQSVYVIQVLCPWCLIVTASTTLIFSSMLRYSLGLNSFGIPAATDKKLQSFLSTGLYPMVIVGWFVVLTAIVFIKFGPALFAS